MRRRGGGYTRLYSMIHKIVVGNENSSMFPQFYWLVFFELVSSLHCFHRPLYLGKIPSTSKGQRLYVWNFFLSRGCIRVSPRLLLGIKMLGPADDPSLKEACDRITSTAVSLSGTAAGFSRNRSGGDILDLGFPQVFFSSPHPFKTNFFLSRYPPCFFLFRVWLEEGKALAPRGGGDGGGRRGISLISVRQ